MHQIDPTFVKARNKLIAMFLVLCILDIILVAVARDMWAIGRIVLTIVVMYFVLQGRKWAKWVFMGICSLLIVVLTAFVIALHSKLSTFLIIGSLILTALSLIILLYMIFSKDLNSYFRYKRQARLQ